MASSSRGAPLIHDRMILVDEDRARQPPGVMQGARVGRVGDLSDGEHDRHVGRARLCAVELTGSSPGGRALHFFRIVELKELDVAGRVTGSLFE